MAIVLRTVSLVGGPLVEVSLVGIPLVRFL